MPRGHDAASPEPVGERAGREGHQDARQLRDAASSQPIVDAQADRLQVEVEVDPVEADRRAEDDRRQQEDPRVAAEAREAAQVPREGAGHRVSVETSCVSERGPGGCASSSHRRTPDDDQ